MNQERSHATLRLAALAAIAVALLAACPDPMAPPVVETINTGTPGATTLAASADGSRIYIGHITYGDGGALKYYDTATGTIETILTAIDVGDFVLDEARNQIIGTSGTQTFSIDLSSPLSSSAVAIKYAGADFGGADVLLHNGTVFVIYTDYSGTNTLFFFSAGDTSDVTQAAVPAAGCAFTRISAYDDELYYTDTNGGQVWKSDLTGGSLTQVGTAGDGSAGMIYFHNSRAFVADGWPVQGVYTFDPASSAPVTATHFPNSAAISGQFMAFTSATEAFVTNYGGGVYGFDPGDSASSFTIVLNTDPAHVDGIGYGLQDIVIAGGRMYVAINGASWLGNESELMIVDSF